jgi:hypothetical protein
MGDETRRYIEVGIIAMVLPVEEARGPAIV